MKPKAELMKRLHKARKDAGMVKISVWVMPEDVPAVRAMDRTASGRKIK